MSDALIPLPRGFPGTITETSLELPPDLSITRWASVLQTLGGLTRATPWLLGDALCYGERYGEAHSQYLEHTGLRPQTLLNLAWVSRRVERARRRESLSWSHHEAVAGLDPVEQDAWLAQAEAADKAGFPWSVATMRRALRATRVHALDNGQVSLQVLGDRLAEAVLALSSGPLTEEPALWNAACGLAHEWQQRRRE
jgi:hypothetical protein